MRVSSKNGKILSRECLTNYSTTLSGSICPNCGDRNCSGVDVATTITTVTPLKPSWKASPNMQNFLTKLDSFKKLESNWDGYQAEKPLNDAITYSAKFANVLESLNQGIYFVAPSPDGKILIELQNNKKSIEFYISNEENIEYLLVDENTNDEKEGNLIGKDFEKLEEFVVWLNKK